MIAVTVGLLGLMFGHLDGRAPGGKPSNRPNCLQRTVSPRLINQLLYKTETLTNSLPTDRQIEKTTDHSYSPQLVECPTRPKWTKTTIRKMENTFKKLDTNGTYKAIGEFKTVLLWISDMRERKGRSEEQCQ
ncbi:unnamed protein product [Coregonus sp. 'balchen']|nr:unnamed protein product [Coregonus sp. 'balchen']